MRPCNHIGKYGVEMCVCLRPIPRHYKESNDLCLSHFLFFLRKSCSPHHHRLDGTDFIFHWSFVWKVKTCIHFISFTNKECFCLFCSTAETHKHTHVVSPFLLFSAFMCQNSFFWQSSIFAVHSHDLFSSNRLKPKTESLVMLSLWLVTPRLHLMDFKAWWRCCVHSCLLMERIKSVRT